MMKNNGTLLWISKRPKLLEQQHFLGLRELLAHHGYEITWLDLSSPSSTSNLETWLTQNIPANICAITYGDKDLKLYSTVARIMRASLDVKLKNIPLFWIYEDFDHNLLEQLVDVGVDDFFHVSHKPDDLISRLKLRIHESQAKINQDMRWQEQAKQNAKAETVLKQREEFLSVCAHDLRSPLGLIQTSIAMTLSAPQAKTFTAFQIELLMRAKRQAGHAISLVNDLLDVMSFEQGWKPHYEVTVVDDLLTEMYNDYAFQAEQKRVKLHYENPVKNWRIIADVERVRQLFQNLFTNALKFTQEGKNIYLKVTPFQGRRKNDPPFPMIVISLADEGRGIPEKELQRIFDRFAQIKDYSSSEGRGLGLTVAKQISNLHDGNIWVESKEGQGSKFNVLFPHTVSRAMAPVNSERDDKGETVILITEPNEQLRESLYKDIQSWGFKPVFAKDGVETLTFAYHWLPKMVILKAGVVKIAEDHVAALLKSDVLTANIPIVLAVEDDKNFSGGTASKAFDRVLKHPLKRESLEDLLPENLSKKIKKAA
jgi:signal transduction histidine kinase